MDVEITSRLEPFTPAAFKSRMANIFYGYDDPEVNHKRMDEVMCEFLRQLGYGDGVDIFESAEKWYA